MYTGQVRDAWAPQTGKKFGAPDRLINWRPLKPTFFNLFQPREVWRRFLRERFQIADNFLRNAFEPGNLCLLASYFRLFYWNLSALYILTPWAVARLARSLFRPCIHLLWVSVLLCSGSTWLEFRLGHRLPWLRSFVVHVSPSRQKTWPQFAGYGLVLPHTISILLFVK